MKFDREFREAFAKAEVEDDRIPDGVYRAVVERAAFRQTKSDVPTLKWFLKVVDGEHAGAALSRLNMLTPDLAWAMKKDLHRIGWDVEDLAALESEAFVSRRLVGLVLVLEVHEEETRNGRMVQRVDIQGLAEGFTQPEPPDLPEVPPHGDDEAPSPPPDGSDGTRVVGDEISF
jgi:hypothetical protein